MTPRLFIQQCVSGEQLRSIIQLHYGSFKMGIHLWAMDFPDEGTVMQKAFPYHDIIKSQADETVHMYYWPSLCGSLIHEIGITPHFPSGFPRRPFYWQVPTSVPTWISNYIDYKAWDAITNPFWSVNGAAVEASEWISNFTSHITRHVITYLCSD